MKNKNNKIEKLASAHQLIIQTVDRMSQGCSDPSDFIFMMQIHNEMMAKMKNLLNQDDYESPYLVKNNNHD